MSTCAYAPDPTSVPWQAQYKIASLCTKAEHTCGILFIHRPACTRLTTCICNQMCSYPCTGLHTEHHRTVKARKKELNIYGGFFFLNNRFAEMICKFPLKTWLKAFQACMRRSPFRTSYLVPNVSFLSIVLIPSESWSYVFICSYFQSFH